jgi:hypothetical protein
MLEKPEIYDKLGVEGFINWDNAEIFQEVVKITSPKSILEIGFYRGASAFFWLYFSQATLLSVDSMRWEFCSIENIQKLLNYFGNRFAFICEPSEKIRHRILQQKFDFVFIDGGHTPDIVSNDMQLAADLEPTYIFLDDVDHSILQIFNRIAGSKYDIVARYYRKTTKEFIPMFLTKRKTNIVDDHLVLNKIEKWERIFNHPIEIKDFWTKCKDKIRRLSFRYY